MDFFVDSADTADIKKCMDTGLVDGITTNPSLVAKAGRDYVEILTEMVAMVDGPISAEVTASDTPTMLAQASKLAAISPNIVIKVPLSWAGLSACRQLTADGVKTNVTLCFSPLQALAAARCGATYISPFLGRLDDAGHDGMDLIDEIRTVYENYGFGTQILAASIRSLAHVRACALSGADVATVPAKILLSLINHPLTDKGLAIFDADWTATGQTLAV